MEQEREIIDFVPTENNCVVAQRVRDWILANAFMGLGDDDRNLRALEAYEGGHLNLTIGGYVRHPTMPGKRLRVDASFNVASHSQHRLDSVIDPEGNMWYRHTFVAEVSWGGEGSMPSPVARLRAQVASAAAELAERFDAEFGGTIIWSKGMSKAELEAQSLRWRTDATKLKIVSAISEAIHSTCRGMRVTNERFITRPPDCVDGEYVIELENKTYKAIPNAARGKRLWFMRIK